MRSWFDLAAWLLSHKLKNIWSKQIRRYMEALDKSYAPIGLIFCRDLKWAWLDILDLFELFISAKAQIRCSFFCRRSDLWIKLLHKSNIQSFPVLPVLINGFHFTRLFDHQIKAQIKISVLIYSLNVTGPSTPQLHPLNKTSRGSQEKDKIVYHFMSGSINNGRSCRTKHQTTYRRLKLRDFARVCKYVGGVSNHRKSFNDSHRKISQSPYWCQLYELPRAWEKEVQAALEFWKTAAIYCDINNTAEVIPLAKKKKRKKNWNSFRSKDSAGALGSIPFETHSSILSSLGCTKTTSPRFICERIRTFLFLPLLLLLRLLPRTGYNYPAVLKHTNLIEQRNQCGIVLLGLLLFCFSFF